MAEEPEPEVPPTTAASSKTVAKPPSSSSVPSTLALVGLSIAVAVAATVFYTPVESVQLTHQQTQEQLFRAALHIPRSRGNLTLANASSIPTYGELPKYETDIVSMDVQLFLEPRTCSSVKPALVSSSWVPVKSVMQLPVGTLRANQSVFIMRNGANEGLHFRWDGDDSCLHELARTAALSLGVPPLRLDNGVRLASQYSLPLLNAADVEASNRIVHVLLDFDLWVWPGIEVNFTYTLHDNMTLTTKSLSPRVLSLANFITQDEANEIIAQGEKYLRRSPTGESVEGTVSDIRTSYTAFLPDTAFSRLFQHRSAAVARLPSPSYAERIQLVRYRPGEFYRQHLDTMSSKNIVTPPIYTYDDFLKWASVAAASLDVLDNESIPDGFRPGQPLYPNGKDVKFARALVELFWNDGVANHFFESRDEVEWERWLAAKVASSSGNPLRQLLKPNAKPDYLIHIIRMWERRLNLPAVTPYNELPRAATGLSHFLRWIRWAKERISGLGDAVPNSIRPSGKLYPKYDQYFQYEIIRLLFKHHTTAELITLLTKKWYDFLVEYKARRDCIHILLQQVPALAQAVADTWEKEVQMPDGKLSYKLPAHVHHMTPNRFVTLFMYLNAVESGGGTVFPYGSRVTPADVEIPSKGMEECGKGLNAPPTAFGASLFYTQTPDQEVDPLALHGGCPPQGGIKWGSNSFMWNADAGEGSDFWN
ncbi:hypothetical protein H310_10019 [Aphanomyces invadans]|uniref:Prolyl 4-hydroxylase alpha subunit domain-containing protein n=1 Tax=Aphanomyces invadans TaxID=157072 RepID=A0A024TSU3_9STRA|nr:hypothetical protein H310_10019 [Aphanomyces invadans]ETV96701.1 hypothetical protein H310_10019 [Aphanomyces invadans]|eukprot:XP_008874478.1 hypothetical protein H310_10019 [Aphanomyces invadans]